MSWVFGIKDRMNVIEAVQVGRKVSKDVKKGIKMTANRKVNIIRLS